MATVAQLRIGGLNTPSGIYQLRLNFNGSKHWDGELSTLGGTYSYAQWDYAVVSLDKIKSSKPTAELQSESGELGIEFNDAPNLVWYDDLANENLGPIFREHLEQARLNGVLVHAILGRYDDVTMPVTEFVFAGSMTASNYSVAHRVINGSERRYETVKCVFSPAERLNVPLSEVTWAESDMHGQHELIAGLVSEPELPFPFYTPGYTGLSPRYISDIITGTAIPSGYTSKEFTAIAAYGADMRTEAKVTPFVMLDPVGNTRTFPAGNWSVLMSTVVQKVCDAVGIAWDGNLNRSVTWALARWNDTSVCYDEVAQATDPVLSFNLAFGYNWWDGTTFKSPATWDVEMTALDVIRGIAIQLGCWCNLTDGFDANGQPELRFMPLDAVDVAMPALDPLPDSAEDVPITDSDGVKVKRRGFDGAIICPANAQNPVEIEVPFGTHAMGYNSAPAYDSSRLTYNTAIELKSQWKCAHRGALTEDGMEDDGSGGRVPSLNPDGWVLGSFLYDYWANGSHAANEHFPSTLDTGAFPGYHDDAETCFQSDAWAQYYVVHATYESATLTDDEKRERQQHEMLAYALLFGRAIRGERKQLQKSFRGVVAPLWTDIALTQTYDFTPVLDPVSYRIVSIERDIIADETAVLFEEAVAPVTTSLSWRIEGKEGSGSGSIGGNSAQGSSNVTTSAWDRIDATQLTTNTNDWNAGQTGMSMVYVSSSAQITLTGITGGVAQSIIRLINNGSFAITLLHNNAASVASNRFTIPGASGMKSLGPNGVLELFYDATASRWRILPS